MLDFLERLRAATFRRVALAKANEKGRSYWRNASRSELSTRKYYRTVENTLNREIVPRLGFNQTLIDIGCGNGRFTFDLAPAAEKIVAYDISSAMIAEANAKAAELGLSGKITFQTLDLLAEPWPMGQYDIVSCMGVTSVILREKDFEETTAKLVALVRPGGYLLMRDSLSINQKHEVALNKSNPSVYRAKELYVRRFNQLELREQARFLLKAWDVKRRENLLFLFQRPTA
jgi:2-polyprenyl-3-methyl-5-hydroxy-6-metoxy-1,4-benzoquinol methylase